MDAFNASRAHFHGVEIDPNRQLELVTWLNEILSESPMRLTPASADASFRRYYRLEQEESVFVVMDAPPENENTEPFQAIGELLLGYSLPAPAILACQPERGFMLLEDFGSQTLLNCRREQPELTLPLYRQAIDLLLGMQALVPAAISSDPASTASTLASTYTLPKYDLELLETEMELFRQWLALRHLGLSWSTGDEREWRRTKDHLIASALAQPQVFVHRDFHSRNLMVRGLAEQSTNSGDRLTPHLGILDFQDAVHGPLFYDLVSLLKDCYATFDAPAFNQLLDYYFERSALTSLNVQDGEVQRSQFHNMGVQRHLKAAGIFARLWHRDGKPAYLQDVPRTLKYVAEVSAEAEALSWLGDMTRRVLEAISRQARAS